ncbi:esterase YdiI [Salmonella enterica subsp. enterica serovar Agona str. 57.A.08]|nr:esterase YdiI [Salmonella enterica subsp. enterica serovar Agona str. 57.A.08]
MRLMRWGKGIWLACLISALSVLGTIRWKRQCPSIIAPNSRSACCMAERLWCWRKVSARSQAICVRRGGKRGWGWRGMPTMYGRRVRGAYEASVKRCILGQQKVVGLEVNANHVRSARQGRVRGVCKALHTGARHQVWQIEIFDEQGRLCCSSRLTTAIV